MFTFCKNKKVSMKKTSKLPSSLRKCQHIYQHKSSRENRFTSSIPKGVPDFHASTGFSELRWAKKVKLKSFKTILTFYNDITKSFICTGNSNIAFFAWTSNSGPEQVEIIFWSMAKKSLPTIPVPSVSYVWNYFILKFISVNFYLALIKCTSLYTYASILLGYLLSTPLFSEKYSFKIEKNVLLLLNF